MATRKITYDGETYYFNFTEFKKLFREECQRRKIGVTRFENDLAESLHLTNDAIHNWRFRKNGPSDINIINNIAKEFNLNNTLILLTKYEHGEKTTLNDLQKLSVKRIYDSIIDYLNIFEKTNGFNDLWFDLTCDNKDKPSKLCDIALGHVDILHLILQKEYVFLKNTEIYDELIDLEYNDIYDSFDGKLTYAYRFEAEPGTGLTTRDDYYKLLNKLNNIIDKYL